MKHIFIINPAAGAEDSTDKVKKLLQGTAVDYEVYTTSFPGDATSFVKKTLAENDGEYRFYSCGGDGTLNEVVNGVIGHKNASVTVYPSGSGNDFIKYYGTAADFSDINALINGVTYEADVLKVNGKYAINAVHFGLDSYVLKTMLKVRRKKLLGGKNAYTTGVLAGFIGGMKTFCRLWADGKPVGNEKMLLCTLTNGKYVGGSYKCAPFSDNNDGLIEVCRINPISRIGFLRFINIYKRGEHLGNPDMERYINYTRAKKAEVSSENEIPVSIDGELVFMKNFTVEIEKSAVNFTVPENLILSNSKKAVFAGNS